ncbi:S9 family peptidase [Aquabacterium sp.]|uniref:S9 family peptidase n=1 Tax=Aquabacterium sp. TaxID=1872578 RepID=UPI002CA5DAB1|nr:S9 family peptidase [Aquabacterium sp.]HSW06519.1 S9 family peptidase [Aquabacterium sp.]
MARKKPITVDALWKMERLGTPSLSPDGAHAVVAVSRYAMADNKAASSLWLLSTLGGAPRQLTQCGDKDGQPRYAPRGERIGFIARREQQGHKDEEAQFYVIPPDGGEAQRVGEVATGVEAFKWCPDGQRIVFISWVWPELKGAKAQAAALKDHKARKETGYATSEALYRYWDHFVPLGRVPHLHLMDIATGKPRDLFEGTPYELSRGEPDAGAFDVSPDGRRVVFAYDPAPEKRTDGRCALAEVDLRSGRINTIVIDAEWDFCAPRYSPDGSRIAFIASHQGRKHTMPTQLAVWERGQGHEVVSAEWDHEVHAPLLWEEDGQALLFATEQKGQRHLWRFDLPDRRPEVVVSGGWVQAFDKAAGTLVSVADAAEHPARATAHLPGQAPRRIERFNDAVMAGLELGRHEEIWVEGALGDPVQVWLYYPPGFDAKKKYPLLQVIHGGPHTAAGDNWHYRWNNPVFAAQGYVVAAVNYHGSSSFGHAFKDSITHRWGELELQDIEAATDALLKKRYIDKKRVFATGGSYGGFMVAWMNAHVKPGRYAAYVCHAGCFDWTAMFADDAWSWHSKELGAWYWDDMAKIHAQSPHAFAKAMRTPTLVIHGALDYRVPDAQGLAYYNTLKALGVDARLLWFPDENHWVVKPRNSQLWYQEFFGWLQRHDPARQG